jgi:Uma2 family endonuclease
VPVSEKRYIQLALEDPEGKWELVDGCPRKKPFMTWEHGHTALELTFMLNLQLDRTQWEVVHDSGKARRNERNYFQPDLCVVPMELIRRTFTRPGMFEAYAEALPLVVEVWSRSTGDYDVTDKLEDYKRRGDREIWLIHPYRHTLTAWRPQPDGSYEETVFQGGTVRPAFLPNVTIDLESLWA